MTQHTFKKVKFPIFNFRYYFPTYENDNLLCQLDDDDDDDDVSESRGGVAIIAEETNITNTILSDKNTQTRIVILMVIGSEPISH